MLFQSTFLTACGSATSTIIKPARKRNNSQRREELAGGAPRAASPALETRCPTVASPAAARTCARLRSKAVASISAHGEESNFGKCLSIVSFAIVEKNRRRGGGALELWTVWCSGAPPQRSQRSAQPLRGSLQLGRPTREGWCSARRRG